MAEDCGESDDRKTVRREGMRDGRILFDQVFDAIQIASSCGVVDFKSCVTRDEEVANFAPTGITGHKDSGNAGLILCGGEGWVRVEKRLHGGEVAGADGFEEVRHGHGSLPDAAKN
jgi:hypothetical protein